VSRVGVCADGVAVAELRRKHGVSSPTFNNWKARYGGLDVSEAQRLKALLNETLFSSLADARAKLEAWRSDFNQVRPHSSLGYLTPSEYARAISGESGPRAAHPDHSARRPLASGDHQGPNQPRTLVMAG
jgi:putative transposase